MELNHFQNLEGIPTLWEVTGPYLVGGMPLVDLVDLLNLTHEGVGSLGSIFEISLDCKLP